MKELADLLGILRPGSLFPLWCPFHTGKLMIHSPPPPGLGQDNSERPVSRTAIAKQTDDLAGPLFSLSPNLRHNFKALPHPTCRWAECMQIFLPTFLLLPCDAKLREGSWESFCQELFVVILSLGKKKKDEWLIGESKCTENIPKILSRSRLGSSWLIAAQPILSRGYNSKVLFSVCSFC